jgi:hypothetical protein
LNHTVLQPGVPVGECPSIIGLPGPVSGCLIRLKAGVPDFQHNARQLDGAPASRVDAALPIQQFINDLQK